MCCATTWKFSWFADFFRMASLVSSDTPHPVQTSINAISNAKIFFMFFLLLFGILIPIMSREKNFCEKSGSSAAVFFRRPPFWKEVSDV
jgi:hypothetical protein